MKRLLGTLLILLVGAIPSLPGNPPAYVPVVKPAAVAVVPYVQPVVIRQEVYVPVAVPVVRFSFVAAPTTPAPVLLAVPKPPPVCCNPPAGQLMTDMQVRLLAWEMAKHLRPEVSPSELPPKALSYPKAEEAREQRAETIQGLLTQVMPIFAQHCTACHTGRGARDGIRLFNDQGHWAPNVTASEIWFMVKPRGSLAPRMPKGAVTQLTTGQIELVKRWREASE